MLDVLPLNGHLFALVSIIHHSVYFSPYLAFIFLQEHRPLMNCLHPRLSWAILSSCFHISPFFLNSCSVLILQVFFGRPLHRLPCGFHVSVCFVIAVVFLHSVCPIQLHFLLNNCISTVSCFVHSHRLMLLIVFGQKTPRMRLRQWFMKVAVWSWC